MHQDISVSHSSEAPCHGEPRNIYPEQIFFPLSALTDWKGQRTHVLMHSTNIFFLTDEKET